MPPAASHQPKWRFKRPYVDLYTMINCDQAKKIEGTYSGNKNSPARRGWGMYTLTLVAHPSKGACVRASVEKLRYMICQGFSMRSGDGGYR